MFETRIKHPGSATLLPVRVCVYLRSLYYLLVFSKSVKITYNKQLWFSGLRQFERCCTKELKEKLELSFFHKCYGLLPM
jgi:hypothetical protein